MRRRSGEEDEQSSKTVTLIAFACQNIVGDIHISGIGLISFWRESQGKNEQSTVCS